MLFDEARSFASILAEVNDFEAQRSSARTPLKLSVLRNYTAEPLLPLLKYFAYKADLEPAVIVGEYDNIRQEVIDPGSHVHTSQPDIVVLTWMLEHLDPTSLHADWTPDLVRQAVRSTLSDLVERSRALIMVNTLLPPLHVESALLAPSRVAHRVNQVRAINREIREFAAQHSHQVLVIDWERIQRILGEERSFDFRFWYMSRAPFKKDFLARHAWEIVRAGRILKGKVKKCLVLDCDNTLWGGVVGEEGTSGIALDPFEYPGRCFHEFQRSVLNLVQQGVVVALCSKNNEEDVFEVVDRHPHHLIKRQHLAAWRVNWNDKASNIAALAAELNLGLDSFVFVDDSDVECDLVKQALPEVTVVQAPKAPYDLPRLLYKDGLFDTLSVSAEDAQRTQSYVVERERTDLQSRFASMDEYLESLEIKAIIHAASDAELPRVAQLIGKTNQFNLTTRRHPESLVREFARTPDAAVFTLSAGDRFGHLGLVGVLIGLRTGTVATIDTLLMSCRALGRKLELAFTEHCLAELEKSWQLDEWRADYIPTKKNKQVAEYWDSLGFSRSAESAERGVSYTLQAASRRRVTVPFISISGE